VVSVVTTMDRKHGEGRGPRGTGNMMKSVRKLAALASLALIASAGLVPAAAAAPSRTDRHPHDQRTVHVAGDQLLVDVTGDVTQYAMEGALVGEWLLQPLAPLYKSATFYSDAGHETFTGCIDRDRDSKCGERDSRGTMNTTYLYWASFESDGVTLIQGQCLHPITGGTGAFRGARGQLNMYDRLVGDEVKTTYRGDIMLRAVPDEKGIGPVVTLPKAAATTLARAGSPQRMGC
jgi:hypothetical protein